MSLAREVADFLGYEPLPVPPVLPRYIREVVVRVEDSSGFKYVVRDRSQLLQNAASIVLQSDFRRLQM